MSPRSIAVFCGSSPGNRPEYTVATRRLAAALVDRNVRLVYGGGSVGLMGTLADEVMRLGGQVLGILPRFLADREIGHRGLTELRITTSMHERKLAMATQADAFLALPGGVGTLEEIVEAYTWTKVGIHNKACGLLNTSGYYDHFTRFLDHMAEEGFIGADFLGQLRITEDPEELVEDLVRG